MRRASPVRGRLAVVLSALALASASTIAGLVPASWTTQADAALLPIAVPDEYTMKHDRPTTVPPPGVLGNDLDLLGGTKAIKTADPTHGSVTLRPNGGFTYDPDAGYVGTDVFRYRPSGLPGIGTTVTITIANAAPTAANDSYTATTGMALVVPAPGVLANDQDADGDSLTAELLNGGGNGSLSFNSNGSFTYTSGGSFTGNRTFTYRVSDGVVWSAPALVTIDVRAPSPTPTPTPTPPPTPTPTLPLPTLPLPTLPLPTLPLPTLPLPSSSIPPLPGTSPTPTPPPGASPTPSSSATATASPSAGSVPGSSTDPSSTPPPGGNQSAQPGGPGSSPGATPIGAGPLVVGGTGADPFDGLPVLDFIGLDALLEWAVPAFVLGIPGLLLLIAVLGQSAAGLLWLPFARRWLGGFGFRRRRRQAEAVSR